MNSDDDKPRVAQQEQLDIKPRRRGCASHCLRFWWAYILLLIAVVVLVVCLVIFVGIPHIAQSKVNGSSLTIEGISSTNTQTDNYTMSINSTLYSNAGTFGATFDSFEGVMYLEDIEAHTPFANVQFPSVTGAAVQAVNLTQFTPVTNLTAFTEFNTWLLINESVRVTVSGNTNVHVTGISKGFPITFTKTVTLPGLNGFNGINVPSSYVTLSTLDPEGDNFNGTVVIPNPSVVTFEIGNLTFNTYLNGSYVGPTYIDDLTLVPGQNTVPMRANISQLAVLGQLGVEPYCSSGGVLPFVLSGNQAINHGQPLPYFANALARNNQTVNIPMGDDLRNDVGVAVACGGNVTFVNQ